MAQGLWWWQEGTGGGTISPEAPGPGAMCSLSASILHLLESFHMCFPVAHMVKCLPAMRETRVQSLGWEDPLEKEMATHSSTLAWKIPWTEEPGRLQSRGSQRLGHN